MTMELRFVDEKELASHAKNWGESFPIQRGQHVQRPEVGKDLAMEPVGQQG